MNISEIKKMSVTERLQTMETIWDSLLHEENVEIESPKWHQSILDERRKAIEEGHAKLLSMDELKASFSK